MENLITNKKIKHKDMLEKLKLLQEHKKKIEFEIQKLKEIIDEFETIYMFDKIYPIDPVDPIVPIDLIDLIIDN